MYLSFQNRLRFRFAARISMLCAGIALMLAGCATALAANSNGHDDLAEKGTTLAAKYCWRCHGGEKSKGNKEFDILDQTSLLTSDEKYAIVGDTENSVIWTRISDQEMPPEDEAQMSDDEKATFKTWLASGAPIHKASVPTATTEPPKTNPPTTSDPPKTETKPKTEALPSVNVDDLATAGKELLEKRCGECHPGNGPADFDPKDIIRMTTSKKKIIVPGDPKNSRIFKAVMRDSMPYDENGDPAPLAADEKALLQKWIGEGAEYPAIETRPFIKEEYVWEAAFNDLRSIPEVDQPKIRYFSLLNIHNNSQRYNNEELTAHKAALSKVINSLSSEASIVPPKMVDDQGIVWRINMDDYGWNDIVFDGCNASSSAWNLMLHEYPYGISYTDRDELNFRANYDYVVDTTQSKLPIMRADWFIVYATQNELYYLINKIPNNSFFLERDLGIDIPGDFRRSRLLRAALLDSGVSHTNRLMDRHSSGRTGYYWKSYDFNKELASQRDLTVFPLGPKTYGLDQPHLRTHISDNVLMQNAGFEEDGGEIIYQMPNGMQAYMLVDNLGRRLNAGPNEVVRDKFETAGTAQVRNALSCIRCHASGMKEFVDDIAENLVVGGDIKRHAESIFRPEEVDRKMKADANAFVRACRECYDGVLEEVPESYFSPGTEPVGIVATTYLRSLTPLDGAIEMGLEPQDGNLDALAGIVVGGVTGNADLQRRGLRQWTKLTGRVNRDVFDDNRNVTSLHQRACQAFRLGRPQIFANSDSQRIFKAFEEGTELKYAPYKKPAP